MGDRQGDDSSPVVSIWRAYMTEGRARVDGKEKNERERLSHHPKFSVREKVADVLSTSIISKSAFFSGANY